MKGAMLVCFLALAAATLALPNDGETYTDRWDNLDVDEMLANKKVVKMYVDCCMGRGKCTQEAKELKSHMKEGLQTDCAKCTPAQRRGAEKVINCLIKKYPESWAELKAKYDPEGKYAEKYEDRLKELSS